MSLFVSNDIVNVQSDNSVSGYDWW